MTSLYQVNSTKSTKTIDSIEAIASSNGLIRHLQTELDAARSFSQKLRLNHKLGLHRKARGLAPNDSYPYDSEELATAYQTWERELFDPLDERAEHLLNRIPNRHADALDHAYRSLCNADASPADRHQSAHSLLSQIEMIDAKGLPPVDADFSEFQEFASDRAAAFERRETLYQRALTLNAEQAQSIAARDIAHAQNLIGWTKPEKMSIAGFYARAKTEKFWLRHTQRRTTGISIKIARCLQMLGKGRAPNGAPRAQHLPWDVVNRRHQQIDFLQDWMSRTTLTSGDGQQTTLAKVQEGSAARQLAELDIRIIAQFERAKRRGLQAYFLTVTTPSRFHATRTIGSRKGKKWSVPNPNFDPTLSAADSVNWIQQNWVNFRALAQKICGSSWDSFGGTEGHEDATGHRHIIIYCHPEHEEQLHQAALMSFLYSDSPNEPGAKKHRVTWERARSDGGVKKYITELLRYTSKLIEGTDKPSGEAMYAKAIGKRSFSISHDHVGQWRWLRARPHPYELPAELLPAWASAHGLDVEEIPSAQEFEDEQFGKYKNGINGEITRPTHYVEFLDSIATQYKAAWLESDFYNVVYKTFDDFKIETADPDTGEIDDYVAYEAMIHAYNVAENGDDTLLIKSKTRILNTFGEPKKPSGGAAKAPILYRVDDFGNIAFAHRKIVKWTKETAPRRHSKDASLLVKIVQEKDAALQLSIQSQGGAERAAKGFASIEFKIIDDTQTNHQAHEQQAEFLTINRTAIIRRDEISHPT